MKYGEALKVKTGDYIVRQPQHCRGDSFIEGKKYKVKGRRGTMVWIDCELASINRLEDKYQWDLAWFDLFKEKLKVYKYKGDEYV